MNARWFYSKFYRDETMDIIVPVCAAYGARWLCPRMPSDDDGSALVQMLCDPHQVEAAAQDPRVLVMPLTFDTATPVPPQVIEAYAGLRAEEGMTFPALLARLAQTEPLFSQSL